ncbi:MAG: type II CAAX endopeptidase family protein [Candidatus Methanofastidiosia archaeon]|jgi:membrane protease YdiL (CAAX protease family)
MNAYKELQEYPTLKASLVAFFISLALVVVIGSILQFYAFLPGLLVTEWLLIFGVPIVLLWRKKVDIKRSLKLKLQYIKSIHILMGILGGLGVYTFMLGSVHIMENILGPYPAMDFMEEAIPTTWLDLIPWIVVLGISAGICEEVLFRGFIQTGLDNHWGTVKAVVVTAVLFGLFHLDPWRTPGAIILGLLPGYLVMRTGSLYTAIVVHATSNTLGQILSFGGYLPGTAGQWIVSVGVSVLLILIVVIFMEKSSTKLAGDGTR